MDVEHSHDDSAGGGSALADVLETRREEIVERWFDRARRQLTAGASLPDPELVNHLPNFLCDLASALRRYSSLPAGTEELADEAHAAVHGEERWRVGFDLRSVVREYELLQQVIYELLEEERIRVTLSDLSVFSRAVTRGIGAAADTFARRREEALYASEERLRRLADSERERLERESDERAALEQELLAIVSHDLRNPLSAILMTAEWLLRSGTLDDEIARSLERVRSSGTRATELIEDLLDYTRARIGGGIEIKPEEARLHAIVGTVVEEVRAAHPDRQIVHERLGDDSGTWDARRIGQVVANLVANAVQHSPPGTVVRVRSYGDGDEVGFEVHNEGEPVPAELAPHLFEPFRRGGPPGKKRLGLGLYIASRVVAAHDGRIELASDEDSGTTFRVVLPRQIG